MKADSHDLPLSTRSDEAAALYCEGVNLMLSGWPNAGEPLDGAIAADPDFALAHAARARLDAVHGRSAQARQGIERAARLAERGGTERERSHVEVVAHALGGRAQQALDRALEHAELWPRDVVILSLPLGAFGLLAFSGMAGHDQARVDLCERHAGQFAADDWWFLYAHGWSLAENGAAPAGRSMLERSVELRRPNANAVHALAHAMFETGAGEDSDALIFGWLPSYDRSGLLHGHIAWHAAVTALERGDAAGALAIYDDHVRPAVSRGMPINVVSDGASLLWRLDAYGYGAPGDLWREVADYARGAFPHAGHGFVDAHMSLVEAASGDHEALGRRIAALEAMTRNKTLAAGPVAPTICRAALAFAEADYGLCARLLEPAAGEVERIGGSGAQREVIEDTLIVALMRSGEAARAGAMLDRRLHRRPSRRDARWRAELAGAGV